MDQRPWPIAGLGLTRLVLTALVLSALVLAASLPAAFAGTRGPAFGNNRYQTEIRTARGAPDVDDYVAPLLAGERLTVTVTADRKSDLRPALTLLRPDGSLADVEVKIRKKGRLASVKGVPIDMTGEWTVRIAGEEASEGLYTVRFKIKSAPPVKFKKQALGDGAAQQHTHAFPGLDGALVDITLRQKGRGTRVGVRSLKDPSGGDVPGMSGVRGEDRAADEFVLKKTRAMLRGAVLLEGHGNYALTVGIESGSARYALQIDVSPTDRPKGRRAVFLEAEEPFLSARSGPLRGVAARAIEIRGGNFSVDPPPTVLFDGVPGTSVSVVGGGGSLTVTPPIGTEGSTVEVAVANPDGQSAVAAAYFHYARPPEITGVLRPDGSDAVGGDTRGGQTFRVIGNFLDAEQSVFFGATRAGGSIGGGVGELLVVTSPSAAGLVPVTVTDPYGRSSASEFRFEFKQAPRFDAAPYDPPFVGAQTARSIDVAGVGFLESDVLFFDGEEISFERVSDTLLRVDVPPLTLGEYDVSIRDRVGSDVAAPVFTAKGAPSITGVAGAVAPFAGTNQAPLNGGGEFDVTGASFHALDRVTLTDRDGVAVEVEISARAFSSFRLEAPAGAAGVLDLTVEDAAGQIATLAAAIRRVGFEPAATARVPASSTFDDFSAWRGALGDLDRDGDVDDLVLVSYGYFRDNVYRGGRSNGTGVANAPGTRDEYTRILIGDDDGVLDDATATHFPAARSDPSASDNWNAMAVALGDLDGGNGPEIVIGGVSPDYTVYNDVRIFTNDGAGNFALETDAVLPHGYLPATYAEDETGASHLVFTARYNQGLPTAIAIGDIDSDGDADMVVGRDYYDATYAYLDPTYVDFTQTPPYVSSSAAATYVAYRFYYYPGTKVFRNALSSNDGWIDDTATKLPSAGDSNVAVVPALHARDLALGDLDGDNDLDLVVAWDDPLSVSPYGRYGGQDQARVATRVLLNDGTGTFTDRTTSWLPAASAPEFWQAHRMALKDLDGDSDLDLVLLLERSVDAYLGTPTFGASALRILRNDGALTGFTDVTATALPALPTESDDNWRGGALAVRDVDGDGILDLLVGTREQLKDRNGATLRSTRLLLGTSGLRFRRADAFLPPVSVDSGEADDLVLGGLAGTGRPVLLRLGETSPTTSPDDSQFRDADWLR